MSSQTFTTETATLITQHLDTWTSTVKAKSSAGRGSGKKREFYGIKKLHELILELAMRGLLVPQDPNDEPASELLKKIAVKKSELIESSQSNKQKSLPPISDEEIPFSLPQHWMWTRLDEVGITYIGLTYSPKEVAENQGSIVLRSSNVQEGKISLSDIVRVNKKINPKLIVHKNDLLICARNGSKKLVGKCAIIEELPESMTFGAFMAIFRSTLNPYIKRFLDSPIFRRKLEGVETTTINQLTQNNLRSTTFPLPPLAEQHRIVAKVDELMALCDQLEQRQEESIEAHETLVQTLLEALTAASDPTRFVEAWQRIASHFDTLFTTESSIDQLKQTILQLAVMGKLVDQDPNDEPASDLLKRIAKNKSKLVAEKKIKKPKKLSAISENEKVGNLPHGWEHVRLNDLGEWGAGATPRRGDPGLYDGEIPWFKSGELVGDYISESEETVTELALKKSSLRYNKEGDVLLAMYGATIGKTSILSVAATTNQAVCACTPFDGLYNVFLLTLLKAYKSRFAGMGAGGAQPNISREKIINTVIALPPTSEQHRIVAKVDELMTLCDALKDKLQAAQTTQLQLTDTLVENAIA